MSLQHVLARSDLWDGEMIGVEVDGLHVVLLGFADRVVAYEDVCPHQRVRLSEGRFDGRSLVCRAHEWTYDAVSGCGMNPAGARLKPIAVIVRDGEVYLEVDEGREEQRDG